MGIPDFGRVRFGERDRQGALTYALRCAITDHRTYVLFFSYNDEYMREGSWAVEPYDGFNDRTNPKVICWDDLRYVLPNGEVTKLS